MPPLQVYGNICSGGEVGIAFNGINDADISNNYISNTKVGLSFRNMSGTINVKKNEFYQVDTASHINNDETFKNPLSSVIPEAKPELSTTNTVVEAKPEVSTTTINITNRDRCTSTKLERLQKILIKQLLNLEAQAYFSNNKKALNSIKFIKANLGSKKAGLDFRIETIE